MPTLTRTALLLAIAACAACRAPEPPPAEQKPEPQAQAQAAHTELRDAIKEPIDKAKAADKAVQDAAEKQRAQIEAEGG
ncbi:hypothetical protein FCE95_09875 [Luteimonas gilva]|uniref:Lipoprotein n=1 Tax=Luteimonas gilva TaxID=2572684 RepID=A0A4U5JLP1_9GAMM|nr:hypothetical protein [Luteimonas gilva]TKR30424.1 hypothetical protein FCE95_09875 [Luteimonas gilva]